MIPIRLLIVPMELPRGCSVSTPKVWNMLFIPWLKCNPNDAMATEFAEVVRRIEALGQNVNNLYTKKLRRIIRPLEKLIRV